MDNNSEIKFDVDSTYDVKIGPFAKYLNIT